MHRSYDNKWKNVEFATKPTKILQNNEKDVNKSFLEILYIYQFCEKVQRQNATMMQLWEIYDVKDSWR